MTAVVLRGDARALPLPGASVDLIVTSPPFFGLRDYRDADESMAGQIGSEATPQEYIAALLDCTRDWMRVLKPSGSLFVELGDSYNSGPSGRRVSSGLGGTPQAGRGSSAGLGTKAASLPAKCLMDLPHRYAIRCVDDLGLIKRAEIIWHHVNGLPESVTDRVRRAHSVVFHFTLQPRYYAAVDEVREAHQHPGRGMLPELRRLEGRIGDRASRGAREADRLAGDNSKAGNPLGKLPSSVWGIPSQPLTVPGWLGIDHFAAFPMELPRRIISGWSPPGICTACGQGRRPVVAGGRSGDGSKPYKAAVRVASFDWAAWKEGEPHRITGYACACSKEVMPDGTVARQYDPGSARHVSGPPPGGLPPTRPAVVLDPFGGTGTTALVASMLGRSGISVDRSADYSRLARWRVSDPAERARALGVPKPPPVPAGQVSLFDLDGEAS